MSYVKLAFCTFRFCLIFIGFSRFVCGNKQLWFNHSSNFRGWKSIAVNFHYHECNVWPTLSLFEK